MKALLLFFRDLIEIAREQGAVNLWRKYWIQCVITVIASGLTFMLLAAILAPDLMWWLIWAPIQLYMDLIHVPPPASYTEHGMRHAIAVVTLLQGLFAFITVLFAVIAGLVTFRKYNMAEDGRKLIRSQEYVERFNSPDFVKLKAECAHAYQLWVMPYIEESEENWEKRIAFQDLRYADLVPTSDVTTDKRLKREIREGLFSILGLLNFCEELAKAYDMEEELGFAEINKEYIDAYLKSALISIFANYESFIIAANIYYISISFFRPDGQEYLAAEMYKIIYDDLKQDDDRLQKWTDDINHYRRMFQSPNSYKLDDINRSQDLYQFPKFCKLVTCWRSETST